MYLYMLLLLILIVIVALLNSNKEHFAIYEYPALSEGITPPLNSCINLLETKGWVNLNDESPKAKERRNIVADMEVSRIPQTLFSKTIHPNVDGCTLGEDVIDLYYNAKGRNIIDPNTCEMRGITADNEYVHHQLQRVDSSSPLNPKGCMINLEGIDKASFEKLLDDAYKLKMYPELKEKKEYREALITLSQQNMNLNNRLQTLNAETINNRRRRASERLSMGDYESERISGNCRDEYTPWNDAGGWAFNFLDRHNVQCGDGEVVSKFQLESAYFPDRTRYKYRCCKIDSYPVPRKVRENVSRMATAFDNSQMWNTMGLTSHSVQCKKQGEKQGMLKRFQLEAQYINPIQSNAKYNFDCAAHEPYGLINKDIKTTCRKVQTPPNETAPTFNYLDRHDVKCNDGEGISDFVLRNDGTRFYYEYSCCKPEIVSSE